MTTDFRNLVNLRFSHAAALARAIDTLRSHDVFGGIDASEDAARDIATSFLSEILSGKCPVLPDTLKTTEGIAHRGSEVKFVEGNNACIEAFHTIIMDNATRLALRKEFEALDLSTNKDVHNLLWDKPQHLTVREQARQSLRNLDHGHGCGCETCEAQDD